MVPVSEPCTRVTSGVRAHREEGGEDHSRRVRSAERGARGDMVRAHTPVRPSGPVPHPLGGSQALLGSFLTGHFCGRHQRSRSRS